MKNNIIITCYTCFLFLFSSCDSFLEEYSQDLSKVEMSLERFRVFTAQMVFGRSVSRDALLMTMPYSLQGLQRGAAIEITPYWVTPDGTTVYGEARTLIYEYFTLRG